jgi:hypothetical protein
LGNDGDKIEEILLFAELIEAEAANEAVNLIDRIEYEARRKALN